VVSEQERSEEPGPGSNPLATVVIPTHDRVAFATRAVASALAQSAQPVEVIVVDDGSPDPFRLENADSRVRVIRREVSGGPCAARNAGLAQARGRWIVFLDDDDELLPDMLEVSLQAAASSELPAPVAVLSCIRVVDDRGEQIDSRCPPTLARGGHWFLDGSGEGRFRSERTLVVPADVIRSVGGFDERVRATEDKDLFLRLNAVCSLHGLARETYRKTEHRGPKLLADPGALADGIRMTLDKHGALIATYPKKHATLLSSMALYDLQAGRWGASIAAAAAAIARDPRRPRYYGRLLVCLSGPWGFRAARKLRRTIGGGGSRE
jgi:glycosyltransferase involved in cell wall biosynthesis